VRAWLRRAAGCRLCSSARSVHGVRRRPWAPCRHNGRHSGAHHLRNDALHQHPVKERHKSPCS
jgi:hypothetical protein